MAWAAAALVLLALLGLGLWLRSRPARRLGHALDAASTLAGEAEDTLPGLMGKARFEQEVERLAARCDQDGGALAVLFVNADNFRTVNDAYDTAVGDRVLAQLARRLVSFGGSGVHAARWGGDEFLLMVPLAPGAAGEGAEALTQALRQPYDVPGGKGVALTVSIGLACHPDHGPAERLIAHASAAMREVKKNGGDDWGLFEPRMVLDSREQAELLRDLRGALAAGQLELFYQPKIDSRSLQVTAAEALLRWHHPKRGLVSPAVFIPVAERFGLITAIGQWVAQEACRQAAQWRTLGLRMRVAINVSAYQLRLDGFVDQLCRELKQHKLQPGRFTVEITESVAMEDTAVTQRAFRQLGAAGLHVAIDDFGVGQASLAYLRKLPASELKIDASFVHDLGTSEQARSICQAVIQMGHALKMRVVAEGVESVVQRDTLLRMGCDELQGFLFAKPMSARALTLWAMDDGQRHDSPAFRASLFKDTAPAD
ncbi:MAG: putative bifunctional diguanylate cyclase/phosphodiesterase [Aquabacterium sp.]